MPPTRTVAFAILAVINWIALSSRCAAQDLHADIPSFAHYSGAQQGWSCNDGFKQLAGFCVRDVQDFPSQNGLEIFDGQWRCRSGYSRTNGLCALPVAPEHASLVGGGNRWECDWGFRKIGARCEEIMPPAHAYLDSAGRDWLCFPGFERVADRCTRASGAETDGAGPAGSKR